MIRPATRLLWCVGIVGTVAGIAAAQNPSLLAPALLSMLSLAALAVFDALMLGQQRPDVTAVLHSGTRQTKDRPGRLLVRVTGVTKSRNPWRAALQLPASFEVAAEIQRFKPELPHWQVELAWDVVPRKRGHFALPALFLTVNSKLGLWEMRRALSLGEHVRVYPNLLAERRRLAGTFLNRGLLGTHAQRRVGRGRDFEKLREYVPGDGYEDIHWKATARRMRPITKDYQVERTQEVYVLLDVSRLSGRTARGADGALESQLERFIAASLTLAMVTQRQGDLFGLVTFSDRVHHFVRARGGRSHFNTCRDALYLLDALPVNPDFEELFSFIRLRLRKRALLIVLTNLDDPALAETFAQQARLLASKHLMLVHMITPGGTASIFEGGAPVSVHGIYRALAGHVQWSGLCELQRELHRLGATMSLSDSPALAPEVVTQYINVKQRQML